MARNVVRTSGRVAAAAFAGLEDQKLGPVEYQFNRRMVFGPSALARTPQMERTQLAAFELQDVCHDAVVMGSSFAEDPAIQAAVLAKIKNSPDLQAMMSSWGVEKELLEVTEIQNQAKELRTELEFQQDLNQDMITHAERLAEERVQLKARVVSLEKENDLLRSALERAQPAAAVACEEAPVPVQEPEQVPRRQRARGAGRQEARGQEPENRAREPQGASGAVIVVQMALAFAAVVIALVYAKRIPTGVKASAVLGAAFNAFGAFRK